MFYYKLEGRMFPRLGFQCFLVHEFPGFQETESSLQQTASSTNQSLDFRRGNFALLSTTKSVESASHLAASEQCVLRTAGTPKSRPEKENRDEHRNSTDCGRIDRQRGVIFRRKKIVAAKPKGAPASKTRKAAGRPPRSSRAKPDGEKLICRYCGSDDLAPSFRRRRDARCRACLRSATVRPHAIRRPCARAR
jgi:hypothetical protein